MTILEAEKDQRLVTEWSREELLSALADYKHFKCWQGKYFQINTEIQRRAVNAANKQDLLGDNCPGIRWE